MSLTSNFEPQLSFPLTSTHIDTFLNFELSEATTRMFDISRKTENSTTQNTFDKNNKSTTTIGNKSNKNISNKIIKKPYKCPHCCKCFPKPSALTPHIYTHTGEKPFQCHIPGCHKRFAVISNLRRHFKVHQPKKVGQKSRISHKERILLVQQLAAQYGNQQKNDHIPFIPPFLQPATTTTNTDYYELPNVTTMATTTTTTTTASAATIMPSLSTTTTCPISPSSPASASSSWKFYDEYNYTTTPEPIVYTNIMTSSSPLFDFHRSTTSSISSSSDSSICIPPPPSTFPFNDCGPVTPGDYLTTFDNSVVESISTTNDSMDPVTQWI